MICAAPRRRSAPAVPAIFCKAVRSLRHNWLKANTRTISANTYFIPILHMLAPGKPCQALFPATPEPATLDIDCMLERMAHAHHATTRLVCALPSGNKPCTLHAARERLAPSVAAACCHATRKRSLSRPVCSGAPRKHALHGSMHEKASIRRPNGVPLPT